MLPRAADSLYKIMRERSLLSSIPGGEVVSDRRIKNYSHFKLLILVAFFPFHGSHYALLPRMFFIYFLCKNKSSHLISSLFIEGTESYEYSIVSFPASIY